MRRKDKQITDSDIIEKILFSSHICRIAIFDEQYPYIVPMNYGYKNGIIYFHSASKGKKLDLLRKNNKVGFEIEAPHEIIKAINPENSCDWTTRYRSIIGTGEIHVIEDLEQKKTAFDIIMHQHGSSLNSYKDKLLEIVVVLALHIQELSGKQSGNW